MNWADYLKVIVPLVLALTAWAIRLEIKIAQIQTDVKWIKREIEKWQPS